MTLLPAYAGWCLGLVFHAATGCSSWFLWSAGAVSVYLALGLLFTARGARGTGTFLLFAGGAIVLGAVFHDRLFLLGDSRLWIRQVAVLGADLEAYRAPVAALALGFLGEYTTFVESGTLLATISVLAGIGVFLAVWRGAPAGKGFFGPGVAAVLVFTQPLSFVFYGHVEVYSLFLVVLAALLGALRSGADRGSLSLATPALLLLALFSHFMGFLILIPLAAVFLGRVAGGRTWIPWTVFMLLAAGAGAFVPAVRQYTLWDDGVAPRVGGYLIDVLNGWFLLAVPLAWVVWRSRKPLFATPGGRLTGWITLTFALFPLLGEFELGVYRDLDLLAPAFVSLAFLAGLGFVHGPWNARSAAVALAPGPVLLAGMLALSICPAGIDEIARHVESESVGVTARAYGAEVLAFAYREQGDLEKAEATMLRATEITPGNRRLYGPLAEFQLERGDTASAIDNLARSMDSNRAVVSGPLLAELLARRNRPREAVDLLDPQRDSMLLNPRAAAALAVAYFRLDLPESTVAVSDARLLIAPNDPLAHFNRASGLAKLGRVVEAEDALGRAILGDPKNLQYHRAYVRVLLSQQDGEDRASEYLARLPEAFQQAILNGM